jgi:type III pantothenate kinase
MKLLLIDAGNTRIKWKWHAGSVLSEGGAVVHRGVEPRDWLAALPRAAPTAIWISNVAGAAVAQALSEWALECHGLCARFVQAAAAACGITNSYEYPETLGVDRWLGMVGAWKRTHGALLVVAAGTAFTVDAVDATGHHRGGWIVPGYDLMVDALLGGTAGIAGAVARAPPQSLGAFGCNSAAAVHLGACHALAAAVERAYRRLAEDAGIAPTLFLGGGDAARIAPLLGVPAALESDLVLEGLAILAMEA